MAPAATPRRGGRRTRYLQLQEAESESRKSSTLVESPCSRHNIGSSCNESCCNCKVINEDDKDENVAEILVSTTAGGCSTPKCRRFRIPEMLSCPPAPMKRRPADPNLSTSRKSSITFFNPPDIELFFFFAFHRNVSPNHRPTLQTSVSEVCFKR